MKTKKLFYFILVCYIGSGVSSCKKYLEATSDKKLAVISNLQDLQALLDAYNQINFVGIGEVCADNNYLTEEIWGGMDEYDQALYTWNDFNVIPNYSVYTGNIWSNCYNIIYRANTVLLHIEKIKRTSENAMEYDNIKGQAYFLRAKSYLQRAWIWFLAYDSVSGKSDLGLPLRLSPDFNEPSVRSNLYETYKQVISDFKIAAQFLQENPIHPIRPGKAAAYGYLSRCYLSMRKYQDAGTYSDSCLQIHNELMDFNTDIPDLNTTYPIPRLNKEVIYYTTMATPTPLYYGNVEPSLYNFYDAHDLRVKAYFKTLPDGSHSFHGSYNGDFIPFTGIATDEMLITFAECQVRKGNLQDGMKALNYLIAKRWESDYFVPFSTNSNDEALAIILKERRKQLIYRDLRWMDIKRLNKENRNITLSRYVNGKQYILHPNDLRYALAIPEDIIVLSGMIQNPR